MGNKVKKVVAKAAPIAGLATGGVSGVASGLTTKKNIEGKLKKSAEKESDSALLAEESKTASDAAAEYEEAEAAKKKRQNLLDVGKNTLG